MVLILRRIRSEIYFLSLQPSRIVIGNKPINRFLNGFIKRCEFEVGQVFSQLIVTSGFLVLAITSGCVVFPFSIKFVSFGNRFGSFVDRFLFGLRDRKNDWFGFIVVSHDPEKESSQIFGPNKLSKSFTGSPNGERLVLATGLSAIVEFVNQAWDDVGFFEIEVVVSTKNVGWDD